MALSYVFNPFTSNFDEISTLSLAAVGSSPNANAASITAISQVLTLQPADATHPGVLTAIAQSIGGIKTFSALINADGDIDRSSSGTLNIGATNSSTMNISNTGGTLNILPSFSVQFNAQRLFLNNSGGASSAGNVGLFIQEAGSTTGFAQIDNSEISWLLKAPATAGTATIVPGSAGIVLNQSSHDPLTLSAVGASPNANGASLTNQVLNLELFDSTHPGVVSASGGGSVNFLRADGTWAIPPSTVVGVTEEFTGMLESPTNKSYVLDQSAAYGYTIDTLIIADVSGTIVADIQINGVSVTGITAIAVSSTPTTATATAANTVSIGDKVTLLLSSNASCIDLSFTMKVLRT